LRQWLGHPKVATSAPTNCRALSVEKRQSVKANKENKANKANKATKAYPTPAWDFKGIPHDLYNCFSRI
jgi:hypothetical protein